MVHVHCHVYIMLSHRWRDNTTIRQRGCDGLFEPPYPTLKEAVGLGIPAIWSGTILLQCKMFLFRTKRHECTIIALLMLMMGLAFEIANCIEFQRTAIQRTNVVKAISQK